MGTVLAALAATALAGCGSNSADESRNGGSGEDVATGRAACLDGNGEPRLKEENAYTSYEPDYLGLQSIALELTADEIIVLVEAEDRLPEIGDLKEHESASVQLRAFDERGRQLMDVTIVFASSPEHVVLFDLRRGRDFDLSPDRADFDMTHRVGSGSQLRVTWPRAADLRLPARFEWQAHMAALVISEPVISSDGGLVPPRIASSIDLCPNSTRIGDGRSDLAAFPNAVTPTQAPTASSPPTTADVPTPETGTECDISALYAAVGEIVAADPELAQLGPWDLVNVGCSDGYAKVSYVDRAQTLQGISFLLREEDGSWGLLNEDYGSGLCSTDAAKYGIPPEIWGAIGGNNIASC